ncbi:UNKNOWN [Stylonychia lemnae]|uniref:GAR domain-containing protein n=1 Tax=Stylonychia lemnae TaxID=5949 RepID=A0A078B2K7_STYLE|nr:UNKNOWN [Stylonychia lemnae]|eukprot:CDW88775.1 UNKNOWN [Stylonychia lemnae]
MKECEKLFNDNKSKNKQGELNDLGEKLGLIENKINNLKSRVDEIRQEIEKIDSGKNGNAKEELLSQLKFLKNMINDCEETKEKLKDKINNINQLDENQLGDIDFQGIKDDLNNLIDQQLPKIDEKLYDLEKQLKKEINNQRNSKQQEYQDEQRKNQLNLKKLDDNFLKIQEIFQKLEQSLNNLRNQHDYKDVERSQDCEENLKPQIDDQKELFKDLKLKQSEIQKQLNQIDLKQNEISMKKGADQSPNNDIIVKQWQDLHNQSKDIANMIEKLNLESNSQIQVLDQLSTKIIDAQDKFSFKDKIFYKCKDNQALKQKQIDQLNEQLIKLQKDTEYSKNQLDQMILPLNNPDLEFQYQEKLDKITSNSLKIEKQKSQVTNLQLKLNSTCNSLNHLGDQLVNSRDLQSILDELEKLDIELQYETEEIKAQKIVISQDSIDIQQLLDLNKEIKQNECQNGLKQLALQLSDIDDKCKEVEMKLEDYIQKIKEGIRENIQNEEVVNELKQLRQQAEKIDEELRQLKRKKSYLVSQQKILKDRVNEINGGTDSDSTIRDLDELAQKINQLSQDGLQIQEDLNNKSDDLDSRILDLEKYLSKHTQIQGLQKEYNEILGDINKSLNNVSNRMDDVSDLQTLLKKVLLEMEKGTINDYSLKENFIKSQLEILQEIEDQIFNMDEQRQSIAEILAQMRLDQQNDNSVSIDLDTLQQSITDAIELLDKLEQQDQQAQQCQKLLSQMQRDIGDADAQDLISLRSKENAEFTQKFKRLEQDFLEIKKQVSQGSPSKEVSQELQQIEKLLKQLRDERPNIQKVLNNELELYQIAPQKLENLTLLASVIVKIRELGIKLNKFIEQLDDTILNGVKLKRKIGGLDIAKRLRDLKHREEDQSMRLELVKKRFEFIGKGAQDCDGYTSNTEEATFILPEMLKKIHDSQNECIQIQSNVYEIKKEVDQQDDQNEKWQKFILDNLDNVEDNVDLNEKSVVFLEKLADKLEDHFLSMDVKKKLDKRKLELAELQNICQDFSEKLLDMQEHLIQDIEKIDNKARIQNPLQDILVDEHGNPVNLLEELIIVSDELKSILDNVALLQDQNEQIRQQRDQAQIDFQDEILNNSAYSKASGKIVNKNDVFILLKSNGWMKKKIITMIKKLKEVSKKIRENKVRYQEVRNKLERQAPRKLYKAVKGDMVDELFADYINKLNCPVPIKRLGNNQYKFGTKKIFAKIINGKLVIRVGGGYMGIEEFMMYYGQQELQKIQKEEMLNAEEVEDETRRLSIGKGLLGDGFITQTTEEDEVGQTRRSNVNIEKLKEKLRDQSAKKKNRGRSNTQEDEDEVSKFGDGGANTIVGIGDVRKALKKNVFEIKTYEEGKSPVKSSKKVIGSNVEHELKSIERRVGNKLKSNLESKMSPSRPKTDNQHQQEIFQRANDRPQTQDSTNNPKEILQLASQIWGNTGRIFFYFDDTKMIIYPEEKNPFDRVFARVHIDLLAMDTNDIQVHFFHQYNIKSQKDKNAVLICPLNFPLFVENLKILVELGYDAQFKLTQNQSDVDIKKYFDISATTPAGNTVRSNVEISCIFDMQLFPEEFQEKEVNFVIDQNGCQNILHKFASRLNIIMDDYANISFKASRDEQSDTQLDPEVENGQQLYNMELSSSRMTTTIRNKTYQAQLTDVSNIRGEYSVCLKKDMFTKFFSALKIPGSAQLRIDHEESFEMKYTFEKNHNIYLIIRASNFNP